MNKPLSRAGSVRAAKNVGATPAQMPQALAVLNGYSPKKGLTMSTRIAANVEASPEQLAAIEATWLERARLQNLPHPSSPAYRTKECDYFVGAMSALAALGYVVSPKWAIRIVSQQNIVEVPRT